MSSAKGPVGGGSLRAGSRLPFAEAVAGLCPCGGTFRMGFTRGTPCCVHSLPMCAEFRDLDIPEFLAFVRERIEAGTHDLSWGLRPSGVN